MSSARIPALGAHRLADGRWSFCVWAPHRSRVDVRLLDQSDRVETLERTDDGYHVGLLENVRAGDRYFFRLDGDLERPDPASRFQPEGVHAPSACVANDFAWSRDVWRTPSIEHLVLYELHPAAFTEHGTLDAAIERLDALAELGITAISLTPVAQNPGERNWGYDGVDLFAVSKAYGGPEALKRLVDACHARSLAVVLDVVYNHLGPEGNYLRDFGPYFTDRYHTPWGDALNFDGAESDHVRRFFIENALQWIDEFRIDGLRLDAVHAIVDSTAKPFLEELTEAVHERAATLDRTVYVIAESADNDARLLRPAEIGGFGMDAQWSDDFHHALHALLTGERQGYYEDFGRVRDLAAAFERGYVYEGRYSPYRRRRHGRSAAGVPAQRFVVYAQNHDQVGNRAKGDRLSTIVSFEKQKLAAAAILLSPFVPMLFMGEEYGDPAPFLYFVDHQDPDLQRAVREGRRAEFAAFGWTEEPPDPFDIETFNRSRLDFALRDQPSHSHLLALHAELLRLRREHPVLRRLDRERLHAEANESERTLLIRRWNPGGATCALLLAFDDEPKRISLPLPPGAWRPVIASCDEQWGGTGGVGPEVIQSSGEAQMDLPSAGFILFDREA